MNIYLQQDYLDYNNLYIFSKSLHQLLYKIFIYGIENSFKKKDILDKTTLNLKRKKIKKIK